MGDEDKKPVASTISIEDFNKYKSGRDKEGSRLNKQITDLNEELASIKGKLTELEITGGDNDDLDTLRKQLIEANRNISTLTKERDSLQAENTKQLRQTSAAKIAAEYGVSAESLAECETDAEMELVAAKAKIASIEGAQKGAPPKDKFGGGGGVGSGGIEQLSSTQKIIQGLQEHAEEK